MKTHDFMADYWRRSVRPQVKPGLVASIRTAVLAAAVTFVLRQMPSIIAPVEPADLKRLIESAKVLPAMIVGPILIDVLVRVVQRRPWRRVLAGIGLDMVAAFLVLIALVVGILIPYPLSLLPLTLVIWLGAAMLDIGLTLGIWFAVNWLILPNMIPRLQIGPETFQSQPGALGAVAMLPLIIYTRNAITLTRLSGGRDGERTSRLMPWTRIAAVGLLIGAAIGLTYYSASGISKKIPGMVSEAQTFGRWQPAAAVSGEIERKFLPAEMSGRNQKLNSLLVRSAAIGGNNLYVLKRTPGPAGRGFSYAFIAGAKYFPSESAVRATGGATGPEGAAINRFLAMVQVLPGMPPDDRWFPAGGLPVAYPLFDRLPPSPSGRPTAARSIGWRRPSDPLRHRRGQMQYFVQNNAADNSSLILLVTSKEPMWWQRGSLDAWTAMGDVFPRLYFETLFLIGISLFILSKRDQLQRRLIRSEERDRISREAHDKIANRLSALAVQAELEAKKQSNAEAFCKTFPDALRRAVADLTEIVAGNVGLSGNSSLEGRLTEICALRGKDYGIVIDSKISVEDEARLDFKDKNNLIACLEEALGNIAKHAAATRVMVALMCDVNGGGRLVVEDDGCGFRLPDGFSRLVDEGQLGLAGMARRAQELGGKLVIESEPGQGAKVEIVWPPRI